MLRSFLSLLVLCVLLGGCHEAEGDAQSGTAALTRIKGTPPHSLTCTVGMLSDVAAQIGGDRLEVRALMGPGTDPHLYNTTPGDRKLLTESDVIFYVGHHLEGKMADVLKKMTSRVPTLAVCERIDSGKLLKSEGAIDPHLWFDVQLWMETAQVMRDELILLDPDGLDHYNQNTSKYLAQLADLEVYVREQIEKIPAERRVLITAHDAFGYFGRAYGIEVLAIQGLSTESEAAVSHINDLVDTIVKRRVPAVFVESTISERNVRALIEGCAAQGHELKIGGSLYSDAMGAVSTPAATYIGMVRHNVDTIVKALQ